MVIQVLLKYDTHRSSKISSAKIFPPLHVLDTVKWQKYINVRKVSEPVYVDKSSFVTGGAN